MSEKQKAWCHRCKKHQQSIVKVDGFGRYERRCPECDAWILMTPFTKPVVKISTIEGQIRGRYRRHSVQDLKLEAKLRGLKGYSRKTKADLITLLSEEEFKNALKKYIRSVCEDCVNNIETCEHLDKREFSFRKTVKEAIGEGTPIDCKRFIHKDEDFVMEGDK